MQLRKVVGAVLNELSAAQDVANEYSRQLSEKYKKGQVVDEKDNVLSSFPVPSAVIGGVILDLKFVIKEINSDDLVLDVDKTQAKCQEIGRKSAEMFLGSSEEFVKKIEKEGVTRPSAEEPNALLKVFREEIGDKAFFQRLAVVVSQDLFRLCQSFFDRGNNLTLPDITHTIDATIQRELIAVEKKSGLLDLYGEPSDTPIQKIVKTTADSIATLTTREINANELIQTSIGTPTVEVIVGSEAIQKTPKFPVQSIKTIAKYTNSTWKINNMTVQ